VVWQGSAGDRRPYADLVGNPETGDKTSFEEPGRICIDKSAWHHVLARTEIRPDWMSHARLSILIQLHLREAKF
jgi:hypothetical protein